MLINWQNLFLNKDVHQQVRTLINDIAINAFSNFIPSKIVTFDDSDPPWMTECIKTKIQHDKIYKNYLRTSKNNQNFQCLQSAIDMFQIPYVKGKVITAIS